MKLGRVIVVSLMALVVAVVVSVGACGATTTYTAPCEHGDFEHRGPNGELDYCHCQDPRDSEGARSAGRLNKGACCACPSESGLCAQTDDSCFCPWDPELGNVCPDGGTDAGTADAGAADAEGPLGCEGECLPNAPLAWSDPVLLWYGAELSAPACPDSAPAVGFEGHADLNAPDPICGACACEPPAGACDLPATMTANAATCALNGASTPHTTFDPATDWTGACDTNAPIPAGKLCSGVKCVQSVTIAPLTLQESCAPVTPPIPKDHPSTWATFARACTWTPRGDCPSLGDVCLPAAPVPDGFRVCVSHEGDVDCPSFGPYLDKHVFYEGVEDTRSCTPCACDPPVGSTCEALISVFEDGVCSSVVNVATATAAGPTCHDLPAGSALGSKSAGPATYTPGACAPSGGEPLGSAEPIGPVTFCCLPVPTVG